jgi:4-diphosphocytidyl-2-C-methyl-D-erythritol kinase
VTAAVPEPARSVTVRVPAKINVHLAVGPRRPDGFHDLQTVFHAVSLYDVVTATEVGRGHGPRLRLTGPECVGLPANAGNLAWRAAVALAARYDRPAAVDLSVDKHIPVAAGLAGGSADAAGALLACTELWQLDAPDAVLAGLAATLGSDVPFALRGRTAVGTGRGEQLTPVPASPLHWVLAAAGGGLRTPDVYHELDRMRGAGEAPDSAGDPGSAVVALQSADAGLLASKMANDLQPAALSLAPYLRRTLEAGTQLGALAGIVSGSGPTCVFLAADRNAAGTLAAALQRSGTCRFAVAVTGDVPSSIVEEEGAQWPTW